MRKRYLCPRHSEATPSAVVYGDGFYCFGCSARGPVSELGLEANEKPEPEFVEDVDATIAYIDTLPRKEVRGFQLPYTQRGYYLVYPCRRYYKLRLEGAESGSKYRGPVGHHKVPFEAVVGRYPRLALIEGEFNALSLAAVEPECDVISPGGAGDFYSRQSDKYYCTYARRYEMIVVIVDNDAAGAQAAIEAKAKLMALGAQDVRINLVNKNRDFNDLLQESKETLRQECVRLGLL